MRKISAQFIRQENDNLVIEFSRDAMSIIHNSFCFSYGYYDDEYEKYEDRDWERPKPSNCPRLTLDERDFFQGLNKKFKISDAHYETYALSVEQVNKIADNLIFVIDDTSPWPTMISTHLGGDSKEVEQIICQLKDIVNLAIQ